MTYQDLLAQVSNIDKLAFELENLYVENGGEVTEETERREAAIAACRELLQQSEGIDMLGRSLKSREDAKKSLKAEKDYITRQIAACDKSIEFIKGVINCVLHALNTDAVKGTRGYAFKVTTSSTTAVDKDLLKELFQDLAENAVRAAGLPEDVTISLSASVSKVAEDEELPAYYLKSETPSIRFTKPRADKED